MKPAYVRVIGLSVSSVIVVAAIVGSIVYQPGDAPSATASAIGPYSTNFDFGAVTSPQPIASSPELAIFHYARDEEGLKNPQTDPFYAQHGANCSAPTTPLTLATMHLVTTWQQTVWNCNHHLMTAMLHDGFGAITLQPPVEPDWSQGPVTITSMVSVARMSSRDWISFFLTPFDQQLEEPASSFDAGVNGEPQDALRIDMVNNAPHVTFCATVVRNHQDNELGADLPCNSFETVPSASQIFGKPITLQFVLSTTHLTVRDVTDNITWVDTGLSLPFTRGVFQMVSYSYDQLKDCPDGTQPPTTNWSCAPDTWHWHMLKISRARPITYIPASESMWDDTHNVMTFPRPAPVNSYLEFYAYGANVQISLDGGKTWKAATIANEGNKHGDGSGDDYWMSIPAGTTRVLARGQTWWSGDGFFARDATIVSETPSSIQMNAGRMSDMGGQTMAPATRVTLQNGSQQSATPSTQHIDRVPCGIVINGKLKIGTCTGNFSNG